MAMNHSIHPLLIDNKSGLYYEYLSINNINTNSNNNNTDTNNNNTNSNNELLTIELQLPKPQLHLSELIKPKLFNYSQSELAKKLNNSTNNNNTVLSNNNPTTVLSIESAFNIIIQSILQPELQHQQEQSTTIEYKTALTILNSIDTNSNNIDFSTIHTDYSLLITTIEQLLLLLQLIPIQSLARNILYNKLPILINTANTVDSVLLLSLVDQCLLLASIRSISIIEYNELINRINPVLQQQQQQQQSDLINTVLKQIELYRLN